MSGRQLLFFSRPDGRSSGKKSGFSCSGATNVCCFRILRTRRTKKKNIVLKDLAVARRRGGNSRDTLLRLDNFLCGWVGGVSLKSKDGKARMCDFKPNYSMGFVRGLEGCRLLYFEPKRITITIIILPLIFNIFGSEENQIGCARSQQISMRSKPIIKVESSVGNFFLILLNDNNVNNDNVYLLKQFMQTF